MSPWGTLTMCGVATQTLTYNALGGLMAGTPYTPPPTPLSHEQRTGHPLRVCEKCGDKREKAGGVELRGKWHCAKCWTKFINGR
jgi:hypothetical protein